MLYYSTFQEFFKEFFAQKNKKLSKLILVFMT